MSKRLNSTTIKLIWCFRSNVGIEMDESQRFSDKHLLSDVLFKREGRYFVRPRPAADKAPLPKLPPHILEQLGEAAAPAQTTSSSTAAAASRTFHTLDDDTASSFVSAQEKLN